MSEKSISPEQVKKIEEIKTEWENEINKIPERIHQPGVYVLDGGDSGDYSKLSKKYLRLIQEVLKESE